MRCYSVLVNSANLFLHRVAFFAARDIEAGEELTFDYSGQGGLPGTPAKKKRNKKSSDSFKCACGEDNCKGYIQFRT